MARRARWRWLRWVRWLWWPLRRRKARGARGGARGGAPAGVPGTGPGTGPGTDAGTAGPPRRKQRFRRVRAAGRLLFRVPAWAVAWFVAVVLSFIAFGTSGTVYDTDVLGWGLMPFIGALVGLPFGLVVRQPMAGWAVSAGSAVVLTAALPRLPDTPWPWLVVHGLVLLALLFAVSVRGRLQDLALAWSGTCAIFFFGVEGEQRPGWLVGVTAVVVVGVLTGRLAMTRIALDRQTRETADEKARRFVLEERTRIARDLHDIVAHHMSLIVVQAETARYRRPDLSPEAREELDAISRAAREALSETRALLSVLRREDEQASLAPQPGIEQIGELCRSAVRAGVPVEARVQAAPDDVRRASSLAAYRIVQESLANAARHAPGAVVAVDVVRTGGDLVVTVENGAPERAGGGAGGGAGERPGHGIIGMREHAVAEGGTLTAGPVAGGGYRVTSVLPAVTLAGATAQPGGTGGTGEGDR